MNRLKALILLGLALFVVPVGPEPFPVPSADGEIFLYRLVHKYAPGIFPRNQGQAGTCVGAGHAGGSDVVTAVEVATGKRAKFQAASIDSAYAGSRNEGLQRISHSRSDGSNGYSAVAWLNKYGGRMFMQPYSVGKITADLSNYSISRSRDWGYWGNGGQPDGINGLFDTEAAKNKIPGVAKVTTIAEIDAALDKACAVTICSDIGFDSPRDKDGFCARRGSWSHCMVVLGRRNGGRKGYLVQNSWGAYIKGDGPNSHNKYQDQPDGSFYVEPATMAAILRQGDSWALSADAGFTGMELAEWLKNANARAPDPEPELAPPAEPIPDEISAPKLSESLLKIPAVEAALEVVTVEDYAKLNGIAKPEQFVESNKKVERPVAVNKTMQSSCANGACYSPIRFRWRR